VVGAELLKPVEHRVDFTLLRDEGGDRRAFVRGTCHVRVSVPVIAYRRDPLPKPSR
jgi:hypothetical protein